MKLLIIANIFTRKKIDILSLILLSTFHLIGNIIWLNLNYNPTTHPHESFGFTLTYYYLQVIDGLFINNVHSNGYNLFYASYVYLFKIFGLSKFIFLFIPSIIFIILIIATYFLSEFFKKNSGLFSSFLVSFSPILVGYSRIHSPHIGIITLLIISLLFLLHSNCFSKTIPSLLFGLAVAIGINYGETLTQTFLFIFYLGISLFHKQKLQNTKKFSHKILNISITLIIICTISYLVNWLSPLKIYLSFKNHIASQIFSTQKQNTLINDYFVIFAYPYSLYTSLLRPFFSICFICAASILLIKKKVTNISLLITYITIPLIVLSLLNQKGDAYLAPTIPGFMLLISLGILSIDTKTFRRTIIPIICLTSISLYLISSFNLNFLYKPILLSPVVKTLKEPIKKIWSYWHTIRPDNTNVHKYFSDKIFSDKLHYYKPIREINLEDISQQILTITKKYSPSKQLLILHTTELNWPQIRFFMLLNDPTVQIIEFNLPKKIMQPSDILSSQPPSHLPYKKQKKNYQLQNFDIIILEETNNLDFIHSIKHINNILMENFYLKMTFDQEDTPIKIFLKNALAKNNE